MLKKELIFDFIDHEKEQIVDGVLLDTLNELNKSSLYSNLSYILKELLSNANKANLKRIHFLLNEYNIENIEEYNEGIKTFKEYLETHYEKYKTEIKKRNYFVKVNLETDSNNLRISVENNTTLLPIEKQRINERIKRSVQFKTIEEVLTEGLDQTEGAGFGLILSLIMLRKLGLDEKHFAVQEGKNSTIFSVIIPLSILDVKEEEIIADTIQKEIKELPHFPQHIRELQAKLENPNTNFKDISEIINRDPLLIADLLKLANSSFYMMPHRVKTIEEAVRQIGFKGVKNLIFAYSAEKILLAKYNHEVVKEIMNHSYDVAFFAYELAKTFNFKELLDEIYTAAMLHDFGRIIITSLHPKMVEKIEDICREKKININLLENLTKGYNHSKIGAKIAEKWNFPESILETIRYHHVPLASNEEHKKLVYIIYLANEIYYFKDNLRSFEELNEQVLSFFNLKDKETFKSLVDKLVSLLEERKKREN